MQMLGTDHSRQQQVPELSPVYKWACCRWRWSWGVLPDVRRRELYTFSRPMSGALWWIAAHSVLVMSHWTQANLEQTIAEWWLYTKCARLRLCPQSVTWKIYFWLGKLSFLNKKPHKNHHIHIPDNSSSHVPEVVAESVEHRLSVQSQTNGLHNLCVWYY